MIREKIWQIRKNNTQQEEILSAKLKVSPIISRILVGRGIFTLEEAERFLKAGLEGVRDPFLLKDMEKARNRIKRAINDGENIYIYGDYDVDGITASVFLFNFLKELGAQVSIYIPKRLEEGYGLNNEALQEIKKNKGSLVITVDCGTTAYNEVKFGKEIGLDVIITDHHEPKLKEDSLPEACAIINPKRADDNYPFKELSGVGVAYKLAMSLATNSHELNNYLPLVALGTIADVVPLLDENRIIVKEGLRILNGLEDPWIIALREVSSLKEKNIGTYEVGYLIGPRLNASGRMADPNWSVDLLLSTDLEKARNLARRLDDVNRVRQRIQNEIIKQVIARVDEEKLEDEKILILADESWHDGVVGLVASKIVDQYHRPTIICSIKEKIAKGSGRSVHGFDITQALSQCDDLLIKYGGHQQACGLEIELENLESLHQQLKELAPEEIGQSYLEIDSELALSEINHQLANELDLLEPYGTGNPVPLFKSGEVSFARAYPVGTEGKHIKFKAVQDNDEIWGIGFNFVHKLDTFNDFAEVAYSIQRNVWQGIDRVELKLSDIKKIEKEKKDEFIESLFLKAPKILRDEKYKNITEARSFNTKLKGVSFEGRQDYISTLHRGEEIILQRDISNPVDRNAIGAYDRKGNHLGFLAKEMSSEIAPVFDKGVKYRAWVTQVTGGGEKNYGLNIFVQKEEQEEEEQSWRNYQQRLNLSHFTSDELVLELETILLEGSPTKITQGMSAGSPAKITQVMSAGSAFKEKQIEAINVLLEGKNALVIMGTGQGKSAVFQTIAGVKALKEKGITIIIYPLRALVNDQFFYLKNVFSDLGLNVTKFSGDLNPDEKEVYFSRLEKGEIDIILTTPEFLFCHQEKFSRLKTRIKFFVVDECHHICTASSGYRFVYKELDEMIRKLNAPLVMAATATANAQAQKEIKKKLNIQEVIIDPTVRDNLEIIDKRGLIEDDRILYIGEILKKGEKALIYVNSREESINLARQLRFMLPKLKNEIAFYNAGLDAESRLVIEHRFKKDSIKVVASTSAFGEGVNIPDIRHVFLYHLNFNFIEFNQQSGRIGRDGKKAQIHLVFNEEDIRRNEYILEAKYPSLEKLREFYSCLNKMRKNTDSLILDIEKIEEVKIRTELDEEAIVYSLRIFEEVELIELEAYTNQIRIYFKKIEGKRIDLPRDSVRFQEGEAEKEEFSRFKDWVLSASPDELLRHINQPIYQ